MLNKLRELYSSLLVRLVVLSMIIFAIIVVYVIWLPLQEMNANYDPQTYTRNLILQDLFKLRNSEDGFESSKVIAEAAAVNKNLLVYFESDDAVFELGGPPQWRNYVDFSHPDLLAKRSAKGTSCGGSQAVASAKFEDEFGTEGIFFLRECGADSYYAEVSGVQFPVSDAGNPIGLFPEPVFWNAITNPAIAAVSILIGAFVVIGLGLRSVMRIARVAHSVVLPLVKALNKMLEKLQQAREKQHFFLATSAHEIRTPLAIMRVRLEEIPDDASREDLRADVRNLSRLVEDLLRLLSVRNTGQPDGRVDLTKLARSVVADRAPIAVKKGVDVGVEIEVDSVVIQGDERR